MTRRIDLLSPTLLIMLGATSWVGDGANLLLIGVIALVCVAATYVVIIAVIRRGAWTEVTPKAVYASSTADAREHLLLRYRHPAVHADTSLT